MLQEGLVVFFSTHDSIKADNLCLEKKVEASLIPTHTSITLGCGFMMKIKWDSFADLVKLLEEHDVRYKALYYSEKMGIKREVELLYESK